MDPTYAAAQTRFAALAFETLLLGYLTVVNHVSLPPWNNLRSMTAEWRSTLIGVLPGLFVIIALGLGDKLLLVISALWCWGWLGAQVWQWWLPHLAGPTSLHADFGWYERSGLHRTWTPLPRKPGRPTPDGQHLTLELLTLITTVLVTLSAIES